VGDATSGSSTRRVAPALGRLRRRVVPARRTAGTPWLPGSGARPLSGSEAPGQSFAAGVLAELMFAGLFRLAELGVCKDAIGNSLGSRIFIF
jgi:hypothetical protein